MIRKQPVYEVLRALFAKSGNQCAFPGCTEPLINAQNLFISQLCHIEAASPRGQRYNPGQSDEERRSFGNLVLMCYPHHIETNNVVKYPVESLKKIKLEHENKFQTNPFKVNEELIYKIKFEMDQFWSEIELLNTVKNAFFGVLCGPSGPNLSSGRLRRHFSKKRSIFPPVQKIEKT